MPGDPTPIRQVLLKVHSRCNLACDYCYVYRHADQGWRAQPPAMSRDTVLTTAERIEEHVLRHGIDRMSVVLHGGEPLLAGAELIDFIAETVRARVPAGTRVEIGVQTNGLLLDDAFLALFSRHRIWVGVSLDGGALANDRHRRHASGSGSYTGVVAALRRLMDRPEVYSGLLATVDLRNDPLAVYEDLISFTPPRLDFLLPHGTWSTPPPGRGDDPAQTPYGDWLVHVFDRWYGAPWQETRIRLFESLLSLLLGGASGSESVGLSPVDLLTVETDGTIEQGDVLKVTGPGMAATGMHVRTHSFDDALQHPGIRARQDGMAALSQQCRDCRLVRVCGGGHYAHRYRVDKGFANPSVYCPDLMRLIDHIRGRMQADLFAGQPA